MAIRKATAIWNGTLRDGDGTLDSETGSVTGAYSFGSRFEEAAGTNPEELIAAAHAGCFSMALSGELEGAGHPPETIRTEGRVHLEKDEAGFSITRIRLSTEARVPGISEPDFEAAVRAAKEGCPVSRALGAVTIEAEGRLLS